MSPMDARRSAGEKVVGRLQRGGLAALRRWVMKVRRWPEKAEEPARARYGIPIAHETRNGRRANNALRAVGVARPENHADYA